MTETLRQMLDLPALVLALMLVGAAWVAWRAHGSGRFDWGNMLRDADGKESAQRFAVLGAFAVSSWFVMRMAFRVDQPDPQIFWAYLVAWSGAHVLTKAAEKWDGRLPMTPAAPPAAPK